MDSKSFNDVIESIKLLMVLKKYGIENVHIGIYILQKYLQILKVFKKLWDWFGQKKTK